MVEEAMDVIFDAEDRLISVLEDGTCPDCNEELDLQQVAGLPAWLIEQNMHPFMTQPQVGAEFIVQWNDNPMLTDRGVYRYRCGKCKKLFDAYQGKGWDWYLAEGRAE